MTDELDDLKSALRALPADDPAAKAASIALAMKNFDALQGSAQHRVPIRTAKIGRGS